MSILSECWHVLPHAREDLWPILSKTDWVNRAVGLPPIEYAIESVATGGTNVVAKARMFGLELSWQELPFEWAEYEYYHVRRVFGKGPIAEGRMGMEFQNGEGGGCKLRVYSEWLPRNALGDFLIRRILLPKVNNDMRKLVEHVSEHLGGGVQEVLPNLARSAVSQEALRSALAQLVARKHSEALVRNLEDLIRFAPDVEVSRVRPFEYARRWQQDKWLVLQLFLDATRVGLLELSWEILCPNCRSSSHEPWRSLGKIQRTAHCGVCQISYDAEFDQSVELKFTIHESIRPTKLETYCLAGPGTKPHVLAQVIVAPQKSFSWRVPSFQGNVRLRSPQVREGLRLKPADAATLTQLPTITASPERFAIQTTMTANPEKTIEVKNSNPFPVQLTLEELEWSEDILTAARVTNWEAFRDLFSREVISPEERIRVGSQVILFTDLRGSTALYREIGDAPAYALVRNHFGVLRQCVSEGHGRVVKTIGDAVMAVFSEVSEALSAVEKMHRELARASANGAKLALKSSLHVGPCLAVNANDRLDYFGTTINLAARLVGVCKGGDVVLSQDFFSREETQKFLSDRGLPALPEEVKFRGFDLPQNVWRVPLVAA